ncbi:MAG: hypothetical protein ABIQ90_06375 [Polaromonas sp.]
MSPQHHRAGPLPTLAALFVVSVVLNYFWEIAQGFLFVGMESWKNIWWHCFVASLGDGLIVWAIHAAGWRFFRRADWFMSAQLKVYGVMLMSGLIIAVAVEWLAVHLLQRWTYTAKMPVLPGVNIGIVPLLQMLILPPLIFYIAEKWLNRPRK